MLNILPDAALALLRRWVPVKERSRSLAVVYSGQYCGSIIGLALSPSMIALLGWPSVFYGFGALGLLWFLWWRDQAASTPAEDPRISRRELRYLRQATAQQPPPSPQQQQQQVGCSRHLVKWGLCPWRACMSLVGTGMSGGWAGFEGWPGELGRSCS